MKIEKKITFSECNYRSFTPLEEILKISENMITQTLEEISLDNVSLKEKCHGMWVFTHNKVHVDSRPYYNQTIRICCEIVKSNALFAYIRTIFINEEGKCIVTVLTELCAIDIVSFRFLRLTAIDFPKVNQEIDTSYDFENIPYDESVTREVLPSMLDSSMHLNNVKSISMYFDTFSLEELDSFYAHSYDFIIKYNAQGKYNDTLTLAKGKRDNIYGYELKSADGKCIVTVQIVYH